MLFWYKVLQSLVFSYKKGGEDRQHACWIVSNEQQKKEQYVQNYENL